MRELGLLGCAPFDDTSALEHQSHPKHPSLPGTGYFVPTTVSPASVLAALCAFTPATSPGGSKLPCQHLLESIDGTTTHSARDCLDPLTHFVCLLLSAMLMTSNYVCGTWTMEHLLGIIRLSPPYSAQLSRKVPLLVSHSTLENVKFSGLLGIKPFHVSQQKSTIPKKEWNC